MGIIVNRAVVEDSYTFVPDEEPLPRTGDVFVSLARFRAFRDELFRREGRTGVRVPGDVDLDELLPDLPFIPALAIEIARFTDGRAYSLARLLRERHGYRGQLRATGHIIRDQLAYLERVGFDAFELPPGKDPARALAAFDEITVRYQPAFDESAPLFRR